MSDPTIIVFSSKHVGLEIPYLTLMENLNWTTSHVVPVHLVEALQGRGDLRSGYHVQLLTNGRAEIWRQKGWEAEEVFSAAAGRLSST